MSESSPAFLETADAIGARLCRDALWAGQRANWLGPSMEAHGTWQIVVRTFGPELYSGTSGIALFLGRLYGFAHESLYRQTALGAVRQAISRAGDIPPQAVLSFYTGLTGIAYALTELAVLLEDDSLQERAIELLCLLPPDPPVDHGIDVLGGTAGAIPALLALHRRTRQDILLDLALRCGERLLAMARRGSEGWSWNTLNIPESRRRQDLLGFSHGAGGIGWALLELYGVTGEDRFKEAAAQAFQYERHWFSLEQGNWPDFRGLYDVVPGSPAGPGFMTAWCHGAPGIGLARLRAYQMLGDDTYRREAELAVSTTSRALQASLLSGQDNYSLCHGLAGNAELLLYAASTLGNDGYRALAEQVGLYGVQRYHLGRAPWPGGVMGAGEGPGLFLGIAGTGHFYLRLYDPARVPPITLLAVPGAETPRSQTD